MRLVNLFIIAISLLLGSCHLTNTSFENDLMSKDDNYFQYNNSKISYSDKGSGGMFFYLSMVSHLHHTPGDIWKNIIVVNTGLSV